MDCPGCGVEMVDLEGDDQTLRKCGECGGLWVDVADLNRMLLHAGMPTLESLGGKVNALELTGQCPECHVDMVQVEGGDKSRVLDYDTCESCGGVFLESEFKETSDFASAEKEIVEFFSDFSSRSGRKKAAAT